MKIKNVIAAMLISAAVLTTPVAALEVPDNTDVHLYMDYTAITNTDSNQYKLERCCKTSKEGIRYYEDEIGNIYYLVALAEYYGTEIGTTYEVTLDNGSSFYVMLGDCKDSSDTDTKYGRYCWNFIRREDCTNVLEFIVDTSQLPHKVTNWGTLTAIDYFNGNITSIEKIGREWSPDSPSLFYC